MSGEAGKHEGCGTHGESLHSVTTGRWKLGGTRGSEEVSGAKLATRSTPFLSRERPTVGVGGGGGENVVLKDREAIQTGV